MDYRHIYTFAAPLYDGFGMVYGRRWWTVVMVGSGLFALFGVVLVVADATGAASSGRIALRMLQTLMFGFGAVWAYRKRTAAHTAAR